MYIRKDIRSHVCLRGIKKNNQGCAQTTLKMNELVNYFMRLVLVALLLRHTG